MKGNKFYTHPSFIPKLLHYTSVVHHEEDTGNTKEAFLTACVMWSCAKMVPWELQFPRYSESADITDGEENHDGVFSCERLHQD